MRKKYVSMIGWGSALTMLLLIFDAQTALYGAADGIDLCIQTVIPSLFPFFFLSGIFNSYIAGKPLRLLRPLGKLCKVPAGSEYLLLIGLTGGYPVGAQCISNSHAAGTLDRQNGERMLAFCNNAGPSFIFGMTGLMFPTLFAPWLLWLIQILCAVITGMMLPAEKHSTCRVQESFDATPSNALRSALNAIAAVCGWVVIFRVMIAILERWVLWLLPSAVSTVISGLLELSNGCIALTGVNSLPVRFIIAAVITVFGGFCVALQTISVCRISCKMFFFGKIIQAVICIPLSMIAAGILFPGNDQYILIGVALLLTALCVCWIAIKFKKGTGNSAIHRV